MKILVVDDNPSITNVLEKFLKTKGHDVEICNDGHVGLQIIQNRKWDKIFLDLSIPGCSGLSIIDNLEKNNKLQGQKIILFSAATIPEYVSKKLLQKNGIVQTFLKKPASLSKITEAIAA